MIVDLKDCDVILDEIHTYSDITQAIVLRIVEILVALNCRIHVGTATMPTILYQEIIKRLGGKENVYEVKLTDDILTTFNRHEVYKLNNIDECDSIIEQAISEKKKLLIVCYQVRRSQELYQILQYRY